MEREIEVKILGIDVFKFEKLLLGKGANLIAKEEQENINIDSTINPISNNSDGYLRIRTTKNLLNNIETIYFTFKEQITDKLIRENLEHTTIIDNKEELIRILKLLGYNKFDYGYKNRTSYMYKNNRFDIDIWDENTYPYPFIEIESKNKDELYKVIEDLGIDKDAISTKSIAQLKEEVNK